MSNSATVPFETTLQVRDTCLCLHAQRAARALARLFDDALRPVGLNSGQFSLLNALNRPQPPAMAPVAQLLAMDRTTLTAALKPLERNGWVTIAANPKDRRSRLLHLTQDGRAVLASAVPIWCKMHTELEAGLSAIEPDSLRSALKDLSQSNLSP
jgi:DNA-binding MarR family transcriptional regulator